MLHWFNLPVQLDCLYLLFWQLEEHRNFLSSCGCQLLPGESVLSCDWGYVWHLFLLSKQYNSLLVFLKQDTDLTWNKLKETSGFVETLFKLFLKSSAFFIVFLDKTRFSHAHLLSPFCFCQSDLYSLSLIPEYDLCYWYYFLCVWHSRSLFYLLLKICLNDNLNEQWEVYNTVVIKWI